MGKRVALRRRTPLRADPVKTREWHDRSRQEIPRTVRLAPVNRVRKARLSEHQYGPAGYGDWLRSLACVVTGCTDDRIECAHVRSRGAGGDWTSTVPMCRDHHSECHALGVATFQRRQLLDLADLAAVHQLRWRAFAGDRSLDLSEPLVSEQEPTPGGIIVEPGAQDFTDSRADVFHSSNLR